MDFDPWWLILVPILFGLGWVAARVDVRQMLSETRRLPDSYFRGLNFLLNEQPDRAIDAFIEVAKLDPETVELHFALGSLFRRRGELERAIRVHQNLMQRSDLPEPQREQALYELAHDYLKAGMLDRAEEGFVRLQTSARFATDAVRSMIRIYEAEHDWPKAIAAMQTLRKLVDEPVPQAVHYHCEEVLLALAQQPPDSDAAQIALDAAGRCLEQESSNSQVSVQGHIRVALLRAQLANLEGDLAQAQAALEPVLQRYPEYAGMIAEPWLATFQTPETREAALQLLQGIFHQAPSQDLFDAIFRGIQTVSGVADSWRFASEALRRHPALSGLERLLKAQIEAGGLAQTGMSDDSARLVHTIIQRPAQRLGRYACQACGFRARRFYWQCPGCNAWETYLPKRLEELEGS